ncbi:hypothetical protein P171DRAFT_486371 [Karstenula rhodostoma CBS 690.94]|uniref:RING-type domain-containing protein n=1 Tax=Karstenula rhodostoma CBS 690.94 TaxID=1392251 RepID=A0A9P4PEP1_9PLEO|nr:hypothetical protein P171DRAFT_486371 [Karstenula rhodostoma CBS 690.94]
MPPTTTTTTIPTRTTFLTTLRTTPLPPASPTCAICSTTYTPTQPTPPANITSPHLAPHLATRLPCGHFFGYCCIGRWLMEGGAGCPLCRAVFFVDEEEEEEEEEESSEWEWEWEWEWEGDEEWEESSGWDSEDETECEEYLDENLRGEWIGVDVYGRCDGDEWGGEVSVYAAEEIAIRVSGHGREEGSAGAEDATGKTCGGDIVGTASFPSPLDLGDAESPSEDGIRWSMNGGVLLRFSPTVFSTSSIPSLDLGEAESSSPLEPSWSMNGGVVLK